MPTPRKPRTTLLAVLRRLCNGTPNANDDLDWTHLQNHIEKLHNKRATAARSKRRLLEVQYHNTQDMAERTRIADEVRVLGSQQEDMTTVIAKEIAELTTRFPHPLVYMENFNIRDLGYHLWYRDDCLNLWSDDHEHTLLYPKWYLTRYINSAYSQVQGEDYYAFDTSLTLVWHTVPTSDRDDPTPYIRRLLEGSRYWNTHVGRCSKCNCAWMKDMLTVSTRYRKLFCPKCIAINNGEFKNKPHEMNAIVGGYHSTATRGGGWQFIPQILHDEASPLMGIEIEMDFKKTDKITSREACCWALYQEQLEQSPNWHNFYFEHDGSLNAHTGVEMITHPMTLEYHQHYWDTMLPLVRKYFKGWDSTHNEYGIHITMDRSDWTDLQLARFSKFVENSDNKNFSQAIAQRTKFYRAEKELGAVKTKVKDIFRVEDGKVLASVQRNSIVNIKGQLFVEFRMFKSTLNTESFFKNLEFLDAFNRWSKETAFSIKYQDFLHWLMSSKGVRNRYTNLLNYLARPTFYVKGRQGFKSEWSDMISYHNKQLLLFEVDDFIPEAA
jgi:hypothetical protein